MNKLTIKIWLVHMHDKLYIFKRSTLDFICFTFATINIPRSLFYFEGHYYTLKMLIIK